MAKEDEKKPEAPGVTAEGIVEAIEQDVELAVEQIKDAAHEAVEAVEKRLGMRNPAKPEPSKADRKKD